ncbi:hypothetical protein [Pseudonocardia sp. GCM10023141]|uniref:hypothetical protein n=1 Tax=Pseudonocardia sp. GCM10023141 TaxID=3252653 RepID=UPI003620BC38
MLHARRIGALKGDYEITADGRPIATWTNRMWRSGGSFTLGSGHYDVAASFLGSKYGMSDAQGKQVASAERVGRSRWTITAGGRTYEFARGSVWSGDQVLMENGAAVGTVRKVNAWRGDAEADLPGLDLAVQVFALVVVLTMWRAQEAAAASNS